MLILLSVSLNGHVDAQTQTRHMAINVQLSTCVRFIERPMLMCKHTYASGTFPTCKINTIERTFSNLYTLCKDYMLFSVIEHKHILVIIFLRWYFNGDSASPMQSSICGNLCTNASTHNVSIPVQTLPNLSAYYNSRTV